MNVQNAVRDRRSVRGFKPDAVPVETLREILDVARYAPSGGNIQPWHVHVLTGAARQQLSATLIKKYQSEPQGEPGRHSPYPESITDPYRTRRRLLGRELYELIGIARDDSAGKVAHFGRNFEFFGAPVGLIFSVDCHSEPLQFVDLGIFIQTINLLAIERGLGTCPQGIFSLFHPTVEVFLDLPRDRMVVCGMSLGYPDNEARINSLRSGRAEIDVFTDFLDGA